MAAHDDDGKGSQASGAGTKTLTARCFCKGVHFTVTVALSDLPLPVHLCSCSVCRYTHGALSCMHAPLPSGVSPCFVAPSTLEDSVTGYRFKAKGGESGPKCERFFCKTCGCHVGDRDLEPDADGHFLWRVASSVFDDHGPQSFRVQSHMCADPALQGTGGMLEWLPAIGDRPMETRDPKLDVAAVVSSDPAAARGAQQQRPRQEVDESGHERLRAECHCGGVSFTLPRPDRPETADDEHLRHYVSPLDRTKWTATLDMCDDCRLFNGTHVVGWTFMPLAQTAPRVPPDLRFGTLTVFESRGGEVRRAFCGVCGATVFYSNLNDARCPKGRPDRQVVDVAVGILRAPEGVAAEEWLNWRCGRMSFIESGRRYDTDFAGSLEKGLEAWGRKMYGQAPDWKTGPPGFF